MHKREERVSSCESKIRGDDSMYEEFLRYAFKRIRNDIFLSQTHSLTETATLFYTIYIYMFMTIVFVLYIFDIYNSLAFLWTNNINDSIRYSIKICYNCDSSLLCTL